MGAFRGRGVAPGISKPPPEQAFPRKRRFGITRSSFKEERASKQSSPDNDASSLSDGKLEFTKADQQSLPIAAEDRGACMYILAAMHKLHCVNNLILLSQNQGLEIYLLAVSWSNLHLQRLEFILRQKTMLA